MITFVPAATLQVRKKKARRLRAARFFRYWPATRTIVPATDRLRSKPVTDRSTLTELPESRSIRVVTAAWQHFDQRRKIVAIENISATVSTNHVFRVTLDDQSEIIAKTTLYGSFIHFRQDHRIIQQWSRHLSGTRYRNFLARTLQSPDLQVFTCREEDVWVVFYEKATFYDFLPPILNDQQIAAFAQEMAEFHKISAEVAPSLASSWKSLGSDVANLYDSLGNSQWRREHGFADSVEGALRKQCDIFLSNAEKLGYHSFKKVPVLIDWNIGNFSVGMDGEGFKFFSRWDYDWFRVEPRTLDFYFCARVVRAEGDQDVFSYTLAPFFEERFFAFLRRYHQIYPLLDEEVLFIKESYRFFLLNYVIRIGEHFFRHEICERLHREALSEYFPALDRTDFSPLLQALR